jgi:SGNH domain (fused to AT3 domains)
MRFRRTFTKGLLFALALSLIPLAAIAAPKVTASSAPNKIRFLDVNAPVSYGDGCHLQVREFVPKQCFYGDLNSNFTVYLIGDSHAAQWLPGLIDVGMKNNWRIRSLTKSGCPAAFMPMYSECARWNDEVVSEVRDKQPQIVFISNLTNEQHTLSTTKNSRSYYYYFEVGFGKMLSELSKEAQVQVIEDTPYPKFDVVACLSAQPERNCNFPNNPNSLTLLSKLVSKKFGATWIETNSYFCESKVCLASVDGVNTFRDSSHISAFASKKFSAFFGTALASSKKTRAD